MVPPDPSAPLLIIRDATDWWADHLAPRLADVPIRVARFAPEDPLPDGPAPAFALFVLRESPTMGLGSLDRIARLRPPPCILVLDPLSRPGVPDLARELGAVRVISGPIPPPRVAAIFRDWSNLRRRRIPQQAGAAMRPHDPTPPDAHSPA